MNKEISLPISKLSYTSLTQLLRNPLIFKLQQILGVYNTKMSVSSVIGKAVHKAMQFYYGGDKDVPCPADVIEARGMAREIGLKWITEQPDTGIRYGKTGKRENILTGFTQAMDFYFSQEPEYYDIMMVEEKMEGQLKTVEGDILPIPAVGVPDLVVRQRDNSVDIVDLKVVKSFTDFTNEDGEPHEDYIKIIQAKFMGRLLKSTKNIDAKRVLFCELKRTKNTDGSKQIRDYVVPLDHKPYDIIFDNIYKDVYKFVSNPNAVYLPNLSDPYDGEHAGLIYAQGLINSDMSDVEVVHKVREVSFTTKAFITSRLDSEINKDLLPEERIKMKLAEFGIPVEPQQPIVGSSVIQYRFKVSAGVRMSTFRKHHDDIVKALEAKGNVIILAPIPGTSLIGIEVEKTDRGFEVLKPQHILPNTLSLPIGVTVKGEVYQILLNEMPHLLIAGTTGSGKSELLHTIITALSKQMSPDDMKLILIDPKRVELAGFKKLPHLLQSPIFEYNDALQAISGLVEEMETRYKLLEKAEKRDILEYNKTRRTVHTKLPYIVCIIDEYADFLMTSKSKEKKNRKANISKRQDMKVALKKGLKFIDETMKEIEDTDVEFMIVRLAQMARAVGIHLIISTQRPSADVISGLIRANFPSRIAMTTASAIESGVIGIPGAEKLSGKGDLIISSPLVRGTVRLQGLLTK